VGGEDDVVVDSEIGEDEERTLVALAG